MRTFLFALLTVIALFTLMLAVESCVDPYDPGVSTSVNIVVVDGTINNLAEPQQIRLTRSKTISGFDASLPITGAKVVVVVDSLQVIALVEEEAGIYQLPSDFKGQPGHSYQLRFRLSEGTAYESTPQVMPAPVAITSVSSRFNSTAVAPDPGGFSSGHDLFLDAQDPAGERNYYKWDWVLYEWQTWCCSCYEGMYAFNTVVATDDPYVYQSGNEPLEACWTPPINTIVRNSLREITYDYPCRTRCWEKIYSNELNIFDDDLTDGGIIQGRNVAQIRYYQPRGCLVEIRQASLTGEAHRFYKRLESQTKNTGGLADTPPAPLIGNIQNTADSREIVLGLFTASGVSTLRYWLDRSDVTGPSMGLFESLNGRMPNPEPSNPNLLRWIDNGRNRPPTAVCAPTMTRTPYQPEGWQE